MGFQELEYVAHLAPYQQWGRVPNLITFYKSLATAAYMNGIYIYMCVCM